MISFGNGRQFSFKVAAGALGFAGEGYPDLIFSRKAFSALRKIPARRWPRFFLIWCALAWEWLLLKLRVIRFDTIAFTTKTLTAAPLQGNPLHAWLSPIKGGFVNAVGLANPGLAQWIAHDLPKLIARDIRPIVSIAPNTRVEAQLMVHALLPHRHDLLAVELNPGCPNTPEGKRMFEDPQAVIEIVFAAAAVRGAFILPFILKLSAAHAYEAIIAGTEKKVQAFELINSVPWKMVFGDAPSPLAEFGGGGVSGPAIWDFSFGTVMFAAVRTRTPIIAGGGLWHKREIVIARKFAQAVSIGTGFLVAPLRLARLARRWSSTARKGEVPV